jgi:beta-phosphoglucomutase-like phosphatase (HAD superfamily)
MATKIAKNFEKTEVSFQASLARKVAKQARIDADKESKESNKKAVKTQGQRLVEASEKLNAAQSALNELRQTVSQRVEKRMPIPSSSSSSRSNFQEVSLTGTLKQQIAALNQGA